nr:hypothetical protein [Candidatus Sigynarchaeota archaeon]
MNVVKKQKKTPVIPPMLHQETVHKEEPFLDDDIITGEAATCLHELLEAPARDAGRNTFIQDARAKFSDKLASSKVDLDVHLE